MVKPGAALTSLLPFALAASALAQAPSFRPIPDLPGGASQSRGRALSASGAFVVGMSTSSNGDEALRWDLSQPAPAPIGDLPGGSFLSEAYACSANGLIVCGMGSNTSNSEAFRWTPAGMVGLGYLPSGGGQ